MILIYLLEGMGKNCVDVGLCLYAFVFLICFVLVCLVLIFVFVFVFFCIRENRGKDVLVLDYKLCLQSIITVDISLFR